MKNLKLKISNNIWGLIILLMILLFILGVGVENFTDIDIETTNTTQEAE